jgi:hypothetical protein
MSKRDVGIEILEGIRDIQAYKAGEKVLHVRTLKEPAAPWHCCALRVKSRKCLCNWHKK